MMITSTIEHNRTPFFHDHVSSLKIMIGSNETLQSFCQIELQETAVMPVSQSQPFPEFCGDRGRVLCHVTTSTTMRHRSSWAASRITRYATRTRNQPWHLVITSHIMMEDLLSFYTSCLSRILRCVCYASCVCTPSYLQKVQPSRKL